MRGTIGDREAQAAGTLFGKQQAPRIVGIDEHTVDLPPARHMLVVHNRDTPGMIGHVTSALGGAGVNISDMGVGRSPSGEAALMVIATDSLVSPETLARITAVPGVESARDTSPVSHVTAVCSGCEPTRAHWRSWLGVALLVGILSGAVAAFAASRTQSAESIRPGPTPSTWGSQRQHARQHQSPGRFP